MNEFHDDMISFDHSHHRYLIPTHTNTKKKINSNVNDNNPYILVLVLKD